MQQKCEEEGCLKHEHYWEGTRYLGAPRQFQRLSWGYLDLYNSTGYHSSGAITVKDRKSIVIGQICHSTTNFHRYLILITARRHRVISRGGIHKRSTTGRPLSSEERRKEQSLGIRKTLVMKWEEGRWGGKASSTCFQIAMPSTFHLSALLSGFLLSF